MVSDALALIICPSAAQSRVPNSATEVQSVPCSDVPTKEFILSLNDAKPANERFVIEDLDATRLFVQAKVTEWIDEQIAAWQERNTYQVWLELIFMHMTCH